MKKIITITITILLSVLFVSGCNRGNVVSGKVLFPDGTPLEHGEVMLQSTNYSAGGQINANGTFRIYGGDTKKAIPNGEYQVTVIAAPIGEAKADAKGQPIPLPPIIHNKFSDPTQSGLTCTVNGKTELNITVEKP
ncbi:MAG: carboxypeptidase-like regulatory domain-containing protein [Planctomycetaceae bacterium]|jgi:hypothetical protein|nr:carboxypeptidase-like regulatory domain-containing protein [Planctomycetaceae bacterium]